MSVAVPVPALDLLAYRVPPHFDVPAVGVRVLVPLGTRVLTGCVVRRDGCDVGSECSDAAIRDLIDVLDETPYLPEPVVELASWVADYYVAGCGEAIGAAVPPGAWMESERRVRITETGRERLRHGPKGGLGGLLAILADGKAEPIRRLAGRLGRRSVYHLVIALAREGAVDVTQPLRGAVSRARAVRVARITAQGLDLVQEPSRGGRSVGAKQADALRLLAGRPEGLSVTDLEAGGAPATSVARLAARGLVVIERQPIERDPFASGRATGPIVEQASSLTLTAPQRDALDRLVAVADARRFGAVLVHGVTGSGKTEVYVRLARHVVEHGRRALVLVPEIALTPAVAARFRSEFGCGVAVQHSGLSDGERYDQWQRIRRGSISVVVGTRSAVFAPVESLGLVVVDEEHDGSYKQEESPRYHGRDVAVMRAKRAGALVVLGSATPSLESYQNALTGRYGHVRLDRRVLDRPLASVRIVDMREVYATEGPDVILSPVLHEALEDRLARGEQALVLLNRRGFAVAIFCRECASTLECPNCSVALTVHRAVRRARCHYCNFAIAIPRTCQACGGGFLEQVGHGTERVETEIRAVFPRARVARIDRDTVRRRGAVVALLDRFANREIDVLVGTQMIAKGHDFPAVTLVGVVSADVGLGLPDFRASERTFQLLTQVVGRAGRGEQRGEAVVQTLYPSHFSVQHACRQDYTGFFEAELAFRRDMRYPPLVGLVNVVMRGESPGDALSAAGTLAAAVRNAGTGFRVLGPAPAPLARLRGECRAQFFLKGTHRTVMRRAIRRALERHPDLRRRVTVDVDPISVL